MKSPIAFSLSGIFYVLFRGRRFGYFCSMGSHGERLAMEKNRNSWRGKANQLGGERYPLDVIIEGDTGITQQWERQQDKEAVALFNARVQDWGSKVNAVLKLSIRELVANDKKLSGSLKQNYRHYGKPIVAGEEVTSIGFGFRPEGIYIHLGVGRGYNMEGGTRVLTKKSNKEWNRNPIPWFNPIIEQAIPELVEIVREYCGTLLVNTTRIFINR